MKHFLLILAFVPMVWTWDGDGTYTVDDQGCVEYGGQHD